MKKVKLALVGCGDRGNVYASYALQVPDEAEIVAVVDLDEVVLKETGDKFNLPENRRFNSLEKFLAAKIECDSVINATMDLAHYSTAKALMLAGYNLLLEKPIVNNKEELLELKEIAEKQGVSVIVCHVLRYTPYYRTIKQLINDGEIGEIQTLEMNEHVGNVHFADSFIRGKWSDERECGSGLLLQKCCHDMDLMCWLDNATYPVKVSSLASRSQFVKENAPEGATEFCYQCPHKDTCIYDAEEIHYHLDFFYFQTWRGIHKPAEEITPEDKLEYLKKSDYGRCVYTLERQLVDKQMVTVQFANGSLGALTVLGGCVDGGRYIHIVGTKGEIRGWLESNKFQVSKRVRNGEKYEAIRKEIDISAEVGEGRHSNGDTCIMHDYVRFLNGDTSSISLTSINDSVYGHLCVYAAEESRLTDEKVKIKL